MTIIRTIEELRKRERVKSKRRNSTPQGLIEEKGNKDLSTFLSKKSYKTTGK